MKRLSNSRSSRWCRDDDCNVCTGKACDHACHEINPTQGGSR